MGIEQQQQAARDLFWRLQDEICTALEAADGASFHQDTWEHVHGGGGRSRVLSEGGLIEKGGVNVSAVHGATLPSSIAESVPAGAELPFFATGVSLVIHPHNPHVPTVHMNCRFFTAGENVWWFGGGVDLTPYYPRQSDAVHFHKTLRAACERFDERWYPRYKKWCDDYFYLPHRKEHRGIGGIFFDYLGQTGNHNAEDGQDFETALGFVEAVGRAFLDAYMPIVERRREVPVSEAQRWFQLYRRGRYVEFNLVYDRGTLFGLQTAGRIESILMSLPPLVRWAYNWAPQPGTPEAELYERYLTPQPWAELEATSSDE